jgi:hypothetical protein
MNNSSKEYDEITRPLLGCNLDAVKSTLLDLMYQIEHSPEGEELPEKLQSILAMITQRILERSWSDEVAATGFFVLGKAVIHTGNIDVVNIASKIISKVKSPDEARQILISIENQFLAEKQIDASAASFIVEFLLCHRDIWNNDVGLRERVIDELRESLG